MTKKSIILTAALAAVAGAAGLGATAAHADTTTSWTGTTGEVRDGQGRFKMRGRLQYDIISNDFEDIGNTTTDEFGTRSQVRRAFIGVQGRFSDRFRYKLDFVLNPGANNSSSGPVSEVAVDDAYLEYAGDAFSIIIGESNITSPLEDRISSLDTPFNERAYITNAFGYGRAAGVGAIFSGANWSFSAAYQGDSLNSDEGAYTTNEPATTSVRGTWDPIISLDPDSGLTLLHLGLSARLRDDAGDRIDARPELSRGNEIIDQDNGNAFNVTSAQDVTYGAEIAGQFGRFGFQAEYAQMTVDNSNVTGNPELDFSSYYVDGYWSITGESRTYDAATGSFKGTRPAHPLGEGGFGHLGLAVRYDTLDLTDGPVALNGGELESYAVGLTWIPIDHVLFRLNAAHTESSRDVPGAGATSLDDEADIVSLRTQFDF